MKKTLSIFLALLLLICTATVVSADTQSGTSPSVAKLYRASVMQQDGEKWGYIDRTGNFVIKPAYTYAGDFNDKEIAITGIGKSYDNCSVYFIDTAGKVVSGPFLSSYPVSFYNGYAVVKSDKGYVLVDEYGKVVLKTPYTIYEFQEGLIRYSANVSGKVLYGFIDIKGKTLIPAKYQYAEDFSNGLSSVTVSEGKYALIDKTGKVVKTSNRYLSSYSQSESLIPFSIEKGYDYIYGYKNADGKIIIQPSYSSADSFIDGYAVVAVTNGDYINHYGLIDKTGKYVIKPEYSGITYLGNGLYAVSQNFYAMDSDQFSPKAIFNSNGEKITDFLYYTINMYNNGVAMATDEKSTFFVDTTGKIVTTLPKLDGIGTMTIMGDVIRAEVDGGLEYLNKDGSVIWKKDEALPIGDGISVSTLKYRVDFCTFVEYPAVSGLTDKNIEDAINARLKSDFTGGITGGKIDENGNQGDTYTETLDVGFRAFRNKNLLTIEESGYDYPVGAAHGMPSEVYYFIDLKTGVFYGIDDLFKKGADFYNRLTAIVDNQAALNNKISKITDDFYAIDENPNVTDQDGFIIGKDCLSVFFSPYEIAPYAAGFPQFDIPYGQLADIIDTKGAFWNSFDKTVENSRINILGDSIDDIVLDSIKNTMKSYETNMIDAINQNSFSKVKDCLAVGSSLYNSQKQLVTSLFKKGTKEKLVSYNIYAVTYDSIKNEYKIFVNETVAIKYTGKNYVNYQYSWCYTAICDSSTNMSKLSKIEKW
ncbi:MAG: WG repeat-containing protein [Bacillota bacterium]|nr:WG repeat-containing protein [Bacillota bacterium]